ncbi:MAG: 3-oxoacyl-ACP reductase FabG [Halanaerobium sp. MSAO_Bac5]|nr:MAG: 3-oxoacyl-ACP reductase FabG [Halanaerobium sp. MSAO_Bac5]
MEEDYLGIQGKKALVTGSSRGVGKAIALALAEAGADVAVNYRSSAEEALDVVEEIREMGRDSLAIQADLAYPDQALKLMEKTVERFGELDLLVNNAAFFPTNWVKDISLKEWQKTLDVNLTAVFLCSKFLVNHALENEKKAKILNINSQAAFHGSTTGHAHYAASKGGMWTFTISLAREVADKGINVNGLALGIVETEMVKPLLKEDEEYYLARIPKNEFAKPEEMADIAVFLLSQKADYITGATLDATGGMLMR